MPLYYIKNGFVRGAILRSGGSGGGYRYMPFNSAHRTSRKAHPTPEAAVKGREKDGRIITATSVSEANAIANAGMAKPQRKPEFAVGAYIPAGSAQPCLVPMLQVTEVPTERTFIGPVAFRGETDTYRLLLAACDGKPVWLFCQTPVEL